ncbi:MAG TPA: hypothetical protein VJA21_13695 [Verrucomicrobiae bacterium]
MQKCEYIRHDDLPPLATESQIKHVQRACELDKARLGQSAGSYAVYRWRVHESQLRGAIISHIAAGRRIFLKFAQDGTRRIIPNHLQANVSLFEDLDIYVEMVLMGNEMIIINAHDHMPITPRLPQ